MELLNAVRSMDIAAVHQISAVQVVKQVLVQTILFLEILPSFFAHNKMECVLAATAEINVALCTDIAVLRVRFVDPHVLVAPVSIPLPRSAQRKTLVLMPWNVAR